MKFTMHLNPESFEKIKNGEKTIEVRVYDDKRRKLKKGDKIIFVKSTVEGELVEAVVKDLLVFRNFEEMYCVVGNKNIGHDGISREEFIREMRKLYSKEEEDKYGVVAIYLESVIKYTRQWPGVFIGMICYFPPKFLGLNSVRLEPGLWGGRELPN